MTDDQIRAHLERVAEEAARRAVRETLTSLGLDPSDPAHVRDWHADMSFVRSARTGSSKLSMTLKTTLVGSLTTGGLFLLWNAFRGVSGG